MTLFVWLISQPPISSIILSESISYQAAVLFFQNKATSQPNRTEHTIGNNSSLQIGLPSRVD
jgi:hypothetical protein